MVGTWTRSERPRHFEGLALVSLGPGVCILQTPGELVAQHLLLLSLPRLVVGCSAAIVERDTSLFHPLVPCGCSAAGLYGRSPGSVGAACLSRLTNGLPVSGVSIQSHSNIVGMLLLRRASRALVWHYTCRDGVGIAWLSMGVQSSAQA